MPGSFSDSYLGWILRPRATFEALSERGRVRPAVAAMLASGLVYSVFSGWLYFAGHQPSFTGNPIPQEHYYLWQAVFLPPWLVLAWLASSTAAHGLARLLGGANRWSSIASPLGLALSVPLTLSYVIPEMIVFGLAGHDALITAMRITGPVTLIWWAVLIWKAIRAATAHSAAKCVLITLVTLMIFGVVVALLVR